MPSNRGAILHRLKKKRSYVPEKRKKKTQLRTRKKTYIFILYTLILVVFCLELVQSSSAAERTAAKTADMTSSIPRRTRRRRTSRPQPRSREKSVTQMKENQMKTKTFPVRTRKNNWKNL